MRIKRVRIQGYRCLEDVEIGFGRITTFIGPTGVGKSSVLRALDWFFNGKAAHSPLIEGDVWVGAQAPRISVEVEFDQLTELDRTALGKYAHAGVDTVRLWRRWEAGSEKLSGYAQVYPPFAEIRQIDGLRPRREAYNKRRSEHHELGLPTVRNGPEVEAAMAGWEADHPESLEAIDIEMDTHFFGFAGQARMSGQFDYVFVNVDLRASDEGRDIKGSVIDRIVEQAVDRTAADQEFNDLAALIAAHRGDIQERHFGDQLELLSSRLTSAVAQFTQGRSVSVSPLVPEFKLPQIQFDVAVNDGRASTRIDRQGHGFQRALLIAALRLLAESQVNESGRTIFLAIEEPELFQHPVQAWAFATVLRKIAAETGHDVQIAYATHSPYFLDAEGFAEVRRMARIRTEDASPSVVVKSSSFESLCARLSDIRRPDQVKRILTKTFLRDVPEALFSRAVIIVEGETEKAIFEGCAFRENPLEVNGVTVLDAVGKANIPIAHALLAEFDVPSFTVFDGDAGWADRARKDRQKTEEEIQKQVEKDASLNQKLLKYLQAEKVENFPKTEILHNFAIIEDTLETLLHNDWPEWEETRQRIIREGRGVNKKDGPTYRMAALETPDEPPTWLADIIARAIALEVLTE